MVIKWENGGVGNVAPRSLIFAVGGRKERVGGRLAGWERALVLAGRSNQKWTGRFRENIRACVRNENPISFSFSLQPIHYK